jgi:NADH:ubiquinone oxidoreductase subunit 6 (subunit J)
MPLCLFSLSLDVFLFSAAWGAPFSPQGLAIWLPALLGGITIYLLLPRPRTYPVLWGVSTGLAALVLTALLVLPSSAPWPETVLFYSYSALAILSGVLLVTQHNPARAALSFTLVVLSVCGLFLLLAAPFLMAATIIIYAGAIVVTFLFVIMLAQQEGFSSADVRSREPLLSALAGFLLLGTILYLLAGRGNTNELDELLARTTLAAQAAREGDLNRLREVVGTFDEPDFLPDRYLKLTRPLYLKGTWKEDLSFPKTVERVLQDEATRLRTDLSWSDKDDEEICALCLPHLETLKDLVKQLQLRADMVPLASDAFVSDLSGPPANTPLAEVRHDRNSGIPAVPAENSAYLGRSLFTDYLLPVELGGLLLLVATIGSIAIAQRQPPSPPSSVPGPEIRA